MKSIVVLILGVLMSISTIPVAYSTEILMARPKSEKDPRQEYSFRLLEEALNYGASSPKISVRYSDAFHSRERIKQLMKEGRKVDIQATAARPDWEQDLIPIRIPLFKGLLGYRVLLIHQDKQSLFSRLSQLEELKPLDAILGSQWSITPVWKDYGFSTITNVDYESLFRLIHLQRADYFPRGVNEVMHELARFKPEYPKLMVEEKIGVYLPLPMYFFVSPHRHALAQRLEQNIEQMIADGRFDEMFYKEFTYIIESLDLKNRKTFFLDNPNLTKLTPFHRKELWYINTK